MVFNTTFNNFQLYRGGQFYLCEFCHYNKVLKIIFVTTETIELYGFFGGIFLQGPSWS
jgi:hypothetical protein